MSFRTDLAIESLDFAQLDTSTKGFTKSDETLEGFAVSKLHVETEEVSQTLGKPCGTYATLDLGALIRREEDAFPRACRALASLLGELLSALPDGPVLVAGLGNRSITPDAIGPHTISNVIATRHLVEQVPEHFASWRAVAAIAPGVLGQTGLETGEIVAGVLDKIAPTAVIAVDALAAGRISRLLKTIQITNTGIIPGSGINNARQALNAETLGVPVIAVGVPTVVDGATVAHEISKETGISGCEALDDLATPMLVTTRDIDREVADISRVIGYSLNLALHPHLSVEDIDLYLS